MSSVEMTSSALAKTNMTPFFEEAAQIEEAIGVMKQFFEKLKNANEQSKILHTAQAVKTLRQEMGEDMSTVLKVARSTKHKIEALENLNVENRRLSGCEEDSAVDRSRTCVTSNLRRKLKDSMAEFHILREKITEEYKESVRRRVYTLTGAHAEEETVERIVLSGESEEMMRRAVQGDGMINIMATVTEVRERFDAVKDMERGLKELHQLFLDMAVIVDVQGEQLNDIEYNVNRATEYVEKGSMHLHRAKEQQKSRRCWICIALVLLLSFIALILVPILASIPKS